MRRILRFAESPLLACSCLKRPLQFRYVVETNPSLLVAMKLIIVCAYYAKSALLQFGVVCIIIDGANITTTRTSFYAILTIIFGTNIRVIEPVV